MKNNLTIGTIWQDTRNQKYFELTAINKETGKLQLSSVDEQTFTCMTEGSLHKHYKLVSMSMREFRPELAVVTTQAVDEVLPVHVEVKVEKKKEEVKSSETKKKVFGFVELPDGKVITGKVYFEEYLKIDYKSVAHGEPSQIYFLRRPSQKALLEKFNAKIIYK
jgi:hypothetical protein